jgi:hypothetical protein
LEKIEAAIPTLSVQELLGLQCFVRAQLATRGDSAEVAPPPLRPPNLWAGARERLVRIWGERILSEREVAEMKEFEAGE